MRIAAQICSFLMHPLMLLNFGLFSILRFHPYYVSKFFESHFFTLSMFIAVNTLIMPLLSVYLLIKFRFVDDFYMKKPEQRLLPYSVLAGLLIFTAYQLSNIELNGLPIVFLLASAFCVLLNVLINFRFVISSHAIGAGGLIALYAFISLFEHISEMNFLLITAIPAAGISSWARLYLNAHTEKQVYAGLGLGFAVVLSACILFA